MITSVMICLFDWNRANTVFQTHKKHYALHVTLVGNDKIVFCVDTNGPGNLKPL